MQTPAFPAGIAEEHLRRAELRADLHMSSPGVLVNILARGRLMREAPWQAQQCREAAREQD